MAEKTYCTRCKHERGDHPSRDAGGGCKAKARGGHTCKCPLFADPFRAIIPPRDYRPRAGDRGAK